MPIPVEPHPAHDDCARKYCLSGRVRKVPTLPPLTTTASEPGRRAVVGTTSSSTRAASVKGELERHRRAYESSTTYRQAGGNGEPADHDALEAEKASRYGQLPQNGNNRPEPHELIRTEGREKRTKNCCRDASINDCRSLPKRGSGDQQSKGRDGGDSSRGIVATITDDQPEGDRRLSRPSDAAARGNEEADRIDGGGAEVSTITMNGLLTERQVCTSSPPLPLVVNTALTLAVAETNRSQRRAQSPFSTSAIRARGLVGLRNILTFGSEAQVSPAYSPPSLVVKRPETSSPAPSFAPWKGLGGKKVTPISHDGPMTYLAPTAGESRGFAAAKIIRSATRGSPTVKAVDHSSVFTEQKSPDHRGRLIPGVQGQTGMYSVGRDEDTSSATTGHLETLREHPLAVCENSLDGTLMTKIGSSARENCTRLPTSDALDNSRSGVWPSPLDIALDPEKWALNEGEREVLAAATRTGSVLVRVVTWNLHAKPPPGAEDLRKTLLPPGKFHIFAVGTEECLNSIAKSVIVHSKKEWECLLKETLGASYELLCGHSLQATHNAIFVHRGIVPLLRDVRSFAVATGLGLGARGATLGNKGGVGIAFNIGATSCIFVNSHFAAHQKNVAERNEHFFQIQRGLVRALAPPNETLWSPTTTVGTTSAASVSPSLRRQRSIMKPFSAKDGDVDARPLKNDWPYQAATTQYVAPGAESMLQQVTFNLPSRPENSTPASTLERFIDEGTSNAQRNTGKGQMGVTESVPTLNHLKEEPCSRAGSRLQSPPRACGASSRQRGTRGVGGSAGRPDGATLPEVFDRVVWAGDLNYRINAPRAVVDVLIAKSMHEVLVKNDQLSLEREKGGEVVCGPSSGGPFAGYREGPLNFRPTYKFDSGTDTYDTSSKKRVPAWTDRVLFAEGHASDGQQEHDEPGLDLRAYSSVVDLKTSDHRPVLASFVMRFDALAGVSLEDEPAAVTNQTSSEVCCVM